MTKKLPIIQCNGNFFCIKKETHSFNVFTLCNKNFERPVEYIVCYTCGFFMYKDLKLIYKTFCLSMFEIHENIIYSIQITIIQKTILQKTNVNFCLQLKKKLLDGKNIPF